MQLSNSTTSRRGATVMEYVVTLTVIVSGVLAISTMSGRLFSPSVASLDNLFEGPDDEIVAPRELTKSEARQQVQAYVEAHSVDDTSLAVLSCFLIGACLFVSNLVKRAQEKKAAKPAESKTDGVANLRNLIYTKRNGLMGEMSKDVRKVLDSKIEVSHIMSMKPRVVEPECTVEEVRKHMDVHKAHHILVCNGSKLIGVISDRDLGKPGAKYAFDLMTRQPITVAPSTLVIPAVTTMINKRISCIPVTDDGDLVGVLTRTDLLIAFQCMLHITSKLLNEGPASAKPAAQGKPTA